ncbi:inorganic phosphate transporter, PiT family [Devosia enhydra]|uniref:Phosphate transporter n=1 Tax=Devosia enhydra TaxID=665118 RepID=A0A1K2HX48_9HYPH|nr:inorganic phosphate transporter [Devosia enhydra]SFZ83802.1 inorganic phosphate transporter, PiT family [Devosia enhydra]
MSKPAIDKDLKRVSQLGGAATANARAIAAPGVALLFLAAALVWASWATAGGPQGYFIVIATVIAAYMALNIGANDVANNMGPAVGAKALTMGGALAIAAICEAAGALLAGGDVVTTISKDIIVAEATLDGRSFVLVMMAALLASALWVNLATILGAPVSTTHSVVGGVVGAGVAAMGFSAIAWPTLGRIGASWVISPLTGGLLAAVFLVIINATILSKQDRTAAARIWVPVFVALMSGIFAMYMAEKGLSRMWSPAPTTVLAIGLGIGGLGWLVAIPWVRHGTAEADNSKKHVGRLFRLPLIIATALLSFAHGANDVANAVGPLAAIVSTIGGNGAGDAVELPLWVLAIGAIGIALGLALFGPRLIRTVGEKITKLNEIRGFCVALAAAATVLVASALGLPVSSTHIAIGAVFGVGFLREGVSNRNIRNKAVSPDGVFLKTDHLNRTPEEAIANFQKRQRRYLVRRQHALSIATAWIVTVPAAALLSAVVYWLMAALFAG